MKMFTKVFGDAGRAGHRTAAQRRTGQHRHGKTKAR